MSIGFKTVVLAILLFFFPLLALTAQYTVIEQQHSNSLAVSDINGINNTTGTAINGNWEVVATAWFNNQPTELGFLGCGVSNTGMCGSRANAINDSNQVVGVSTIKSSIIYSYTNTAFIWENGAMRPIITLGLEASTANDINNSGFVVGQAKSTFNYNYTHHAYVWFADNISYDLGLAGPNADPFIETAAHAINDNNTVAGTYDDQPTYWTPLTIDVPGNNFNYSRVPLPAFAGTQSKPNDLNNALSPVIVGYAVSPIDNRRHAVMWQNDQMSDLHGTQVCNGYSVNSEATGVNDQMEIVGFCSFYGKYNGRYGTYHRAVTWVNGVMTALDDLLAPGVNASVTKAHAINNSGAIAAEGYIDNRKVVMILQPI